MRKLALLLIVLGTAGQLRAAEEILNYLVRIEVYEDSSMLVTETIKVRAEHKKIIHGIYRDFPTKYKDRLGHEVNVGFKVISVKWNGRPIQWSEQWQMNGWRVYLGTRDEEIPMGIHTFELTYAVTRELGFFEDHDELYFNAIGHDWAFPIEHAEVVVRLPGDAARHLLWWKAFVGPYGSKESSCTMKVLPSGEILFQITRRLEPREGVTIALAWPKGYIQEPSFEEKVRYFFSDNRHAFIGLLGLLIVLLYYVLAWIKVGRDPVPGPITPQFEPPDNLSPAAVRYIYKMGFDNRAVSALILDLAVKKKVKLSPEGSTFLLERLDLDTSDLPPEEAAFLRRLLADRSSLILDRTNADRIRDAIAEVKKIMKQKFLKKYFNTNIGWVIPGVVLSIGTLVVIALSTAMIFPALFIELWLLIWTFAVSRLAKAVKNAWKRVFSTGEGKGKAILATLFFLPFLGGEVIGLFMLSMLAGLLTGIIVIVLMIINAIFFWLMKAPTQLGRREMDKIEGLKQFLGAQARYEAVQGPYDRTPELFERLLPYAIALDVEKRWAAQFEEVFSGLSQDYRPVWYVPGHTYGPYPWNSLVSSLSGLDTAIASASSPPGSSSGSGGFSGGGGGGGGGGGF